MKTIFTPIQTQDTFGIDSDERVLKGLLTRERIKKIRRWARVHSWRQKCGCEHDCCGHIYKVNISVDFVSQSEIRLVRTSYFNV